MNIARLEGLGSFGSELNPAVSLEYDCRALTLFKGLSGAGHYCEELEDGLIVLVVASHVVDEVKHQWCPLFLTQLFSVFAESSEANYDNRRKGLNLRLRCSLDLQVALVTVLRNYPDAQSTFNCFLNWF